MKSSTLSWLLLMSKKVSGEDDDSRKAQEPLVSGGQSVPPVTQAHSGLERTFFRSIQVTASEKQIAIAALIGVRSDLTGTLTAGYMAVILEIKSDLQKILDKLEAG